MRLTVRHFPEWDATLIIPEAMALVPVLDIERATNGCGREGLEEKLVPDTIWGLSITPVCRVHDWMYVAIARSAEVHHDQERVTCDEALADGVFAANLVWHICAKTPSRLLRWLRLRRAAKYIDAVAVTDIIRCIPEPAASAVAAAIQ